MTTSRTPQAPASMFRGTEGLGVWEHKGKVAAVGIGHSPTDRRWDLRPETSVGAYAIIALRNAMEDAGITPDQVDGLVLDPSTTTGAMWPPERPIPEEFSQAFKPGANRVDGISSLSTEWLVANMPELSGINFSMYGSTCMSNAICVAAQAIGDGMTNTCLVLKAWDNLEGRYAQGGDNALDTIGGNAQWSNPWGATGPYYPAHWFTSYTNKYGGSHDQMAPFVVNSKRNGLLFPEGFWAQHRPEPLTVEDYLSARWIVKPVNLYDCDIPITVAVAYVFTTAERAEDMKQKPVYILNHSEARPKPRSVELTLEECEDSAASLGRRLYEGAGITNNDLSFENMYDGYTLFHHLMMEGLNYRGVKKGEGLDFYQTDISIEGPNPVSPSGGNAGSGRTRIWMHTDCIQQIQGRAGERQIRIPAETGVSGGPHPRGGDFVVWGSTPD